MHTSDNGTWKSATAKIVVKRGADDCYALWRDLEDLADYIPWFGRTTVAIGQENRVKTFNCTLNIAGVESTCLLHLTQDEPGKQIAWETEAGSRLTHRGMVKFQQLYDATGTEVVLTLQYQVPTQSSETERNNAAEIALARFKEFAETNPDELKW
jgi:uncharacterized membrane protein